jgi:hypothetical protein
MKREARLLLEKACDSLLLSIELFNRPHDRGRVTGTLIQLDHAFEMLLKAASWAGVKVAAVAADYPQSSRDARKARRRKRRPRCSPVTPQWWCTE